MSLPGNFFDGSFFDGPFFDPFNSIDEHDGEGTARKHGARRIKASEELRQQILYSIDGFPPELVEKLETVATPQIEDSVYIPLHERIDLDAVSEEVIGEIRKIYEERRALEAVGQAVRAYKREEEREEERVRVIAQIEEDRKRRIIEQDEEAVMVFMMLANH